MAGFKNLTQYLAPDLELRDDDGRIWRVKPPSKEDGLILAAINAAGVAAYASLQETCPSCGRAGGEMPDETRELLESFGARPIGEVSLGKDVYDSMVAAGLPGPHIDTYAMYALYYWTLGESVADAIMEAQAGASAGKALTAR